MRDNSFRFIHCADLHLDSPFTGLASTDPRLAAMLEGAAFRAFEKVVDIAIHEAVDFILISGDIYDQGTASLRAQLGSRDILRRASDNDIQCYIVHGNHDPLDSWRSRVSFPASVHRFGSEVEKKVFSRNGRPLAEIYGISYQRAEEYDNLASLFIADGDPSFFRIGMLHCNLGGGSTGHGNYAPCTMADLESSGMNYWALGHIHTPGIVRDAEPAVVYAGNIQGRDIGEIGKRGCYLVEVQNGRMISIQFRQTSQVLWSEEYMDLSPIMDVEDLVDKLRDLCDLQRNRADGIPSIMRVTLRGESEIVHLLENRDLQQEVLEIVREDEKRKLDQVWIESLKNRASLPVDRGKLMNNNDFIADFLQLCEQTGKDLSFLRDMLKENEAFRLVEHFLGDLEDPSILEYILDEAEKLGLSELTGRSGS